MADRKIAGDFDQELLDLYDEYVHGGMGRREFMARASRYAVGGVTAAPAGRPTPSANNIVMTMGNNFISHPPFAQYLLLYDQHYTTRMALQYRMFGAFTPRVDPYPS